MIKIILKISRFTNYYNGNGINKIIILVCVFRKIPTYHIWYYSTIVPQSQMYTYTLTCYVVTNYSDYSRRPIPTFQRTKHDVAHPGHFK